MEDPVEGKILTQPENQGVTHEQLRNWIETGSGGDPVAVMGSSIEVLNEALKTGKIYRWLEGSGTPRLSLVENYRYAYHIIPFPDRIRHLDNTLANKIEESDDDLITGAKDYAALNAIQDGFYKATGGHLDVDDLEALEDLLFPGQGSQTKRDPEWSADEGERVITEIRKKYGLSREKITEVLGELLDLKGVLFYFNEKLLGENVVPNPEDSRWLMIITKDLLSTDVISGIGILSEADQRALVIQPG